LHRREIERLAAHIELNPRPDEEPRMSSVSGDGSGDRDGDGRISGESADFEFSLDELSRRAAAPDGAIQHAPSGRRLRCLVTNDDGIGSEGLRALALVALEAGLDVVVAAPMQESSGASASITAVEQNGRFVVEPRTVPGLDGACAVLAVGGLPAFIALTGMRGAFGPPPDIVLSGTPSSTRGQRGRR